MRHVVRPWRPHECRAADCPVPPFPEVLDALLERSVGRQWAGE